MNYTQPSQAIEHTHDWTRRALDQVWRGLPRGGSLRHEVWQRRHHWIILLLWGHVLAIAGYGLLASGSPVHVLSEAGLIAALTVLGMWGRVGPRMQSVMASLGLITCSAVLVHLSGGYVETHFHFFVMLVIIALYQDWSTFLVAIGYVVVHHGLVGTISPESVYNHPDAWANPWKWAAIHAVFVLAASIASIVNWHLHEEERARSERAEHQVRALNVDLEQRVRERTIDLTQANESLHDEIGIRHQAEQALQESNYRLQQALAELTKAQQQVVQQERLSAVGQMASGIAHDFNNALAAIVGFCEILLARPESLDDSASTRRQIQLINTVAQDAATVVSRLKEFYRQREAQERVTEINLETLISEVVALSQPKWKEQAQAAGVTIAPVIEIEPLEPFVGHQAELRDALTNLIFNAVDAMPRGGNITLRARTGGDQLVLQVADTGIGMTDEVRRHCLEPFFSTKGTRGTGLGLGMVHGIVRRHGGELEIDSAPGQGTTVTLRLPLRNDGLIPEPPLSPEIAPRSLRVLVVDDDPLLRHVVTQYLEMDDHHVETAIDGSEALATYRPGSFDLVLADWAMPIMGGDELARRIRSIDPTCPIGILTGFGDLLLANGTAPEGVDLIVTKPVTLDNLRRAIIRLRSTAASQHPTLA